MLCTRCLTVCGGTSTIYMYVEGTTTFQTHIRKQIQNSLQSCGREHQGRRWRKDLNNKQGCSELPGDCTGVIIIIIIFNKISP